MSRPIISSQADYGHRFHRTQREAGIDFREWESRLQAARPWVYDVITFICLVAFGAAGYYAAENISGLAKIMGF
jgi:hypothetical protein